MTSVYWLEQTEADVPASNDWLTASEAIRLKSMRFAKRRADWRLGRWTAKRAVAALLRMADPIPFFPDLEIRSAPSGAPEVFFANHPADVTISLSHRAGVALCAIAPSRVALGCDVEIIEPRTGAFVADYFTTNEQALVAQTPPTDQAQLLAVLWSAKESALKALRTGLRLDTRSVNVIPFGAGVSQPWFSLEVRHIGGSVFAGWWQRTGDLVRTLVAAPRPAPPLFL